ncbi:MAG: formylglycine-generating enzyme family protein [Planctomycetaceae bacterium]|nr:formylglycine-generating enzyme family protein [Planctomycetaceae bacterium]
MPAPAGDYRPALTLKAGPASLGLVLIAQGKFTMGSPADEVERDADENTHPITLTWPFYMSDSEVTQEMFQAVMNANPSQVRGPALPVLNVTWTAANEFCEKLSKITRRRVLLPTEAQWEYACRAGSAGPFSAGKSIKPDHANYDARYAYGVGTLLVDESKGDPKPAPVKSRKPNAWGLYDMHGNAAEWCRDWLGPYPAAAVKDPVGPDQGERRVLRGGSWKTRPTFCRSANRDAAAADYSSPAIGFRVIVEVTPDDLKK